MDSEKLLIIGCGDIGRRLAQCLVDEPVAITGLRRRPPGDDPLIHYHGGDYRDPAQMRQLVDGDFDCIVMTLTPTERSDEGYRQGFVEPARALCRALQQSGRRPRRLLMVSSTSVYGQNDGQWVDERSVTEPQRYNGQRVLEAEQILRASGLPVTIVRLAGVYGPGRERLLQSVSEGHAPASPAYSNRIHVDDAARAIGFVLYELAEPADLYLASDGESPTKAEVVRWLATRLEAPEPAAAPAPVALNKRIDNRRLLASGFQLRYPGFRQGFAELIRR